MSHKVGPYSERKGPCLRGRSGDGSKEMEPSVTVSMGGPLFSVVTRGGNGGLRRTSWDFMGGTILTDQIILFELSYLGNQTVV